MLAIIDIYLNKSPDHAGNYRYILKHITDIMLAIINIYLNKLLDHAGNYRYILTKNTHVLDTYFSLINNHVRKNVNLTKIN